jgi:RimJ/RimL family protein N-acetyltransferase
MILETSRLFLTPFKREDATALHSLASNPDLAKWTRSFSIPFNYRQAEEWLSRAIARTTDKTNITLSVHLKKSHDLVGAVSFKMTERQEAELGYWLGVEYQGNGYCVEAVREVMRYALTTYRLNRIFARCDASNQSSVKVMVRCGMQPVDMTASTMLIKQTRVQVLTYELGSP